jgi:hypothetical protein
MTDGRRPLHLAVLVGVSTAIYAASLAAVAAFQSSDDRALAERQAPAVDAVTRLREGHDRLAASIGRAADAYDQAAGRYDALAPRLEESETALAQLADQVSAIGGAALALPRQVSLPPLSRTVIRATSAKPKTSGSTGASGG